MPMNDWNAPPSLPIGCPTPTHPPHKQTQPIKPPKQARLMAREGEYDPIFWRHRKTKQEAALPPRTQGPRLVSHGAWVCLSV
jgi:hypothetical protein